MTNKNKNYILSIETTSKVCGVSLICNDEILYENNIDVGLNHSVTLFENIDSALKETKVDFSKINVIKVSNGPGSFTGIRIGIAAALGLSEKYNTDIEYIDTLDGLAYNVKNKNDYIICMLDAKVNRVFFSVYNSKTLKKISNDLIITVKDFCDLSNKFLGKYKGCFSLVGDGAVNYKDYINKNLKINYKIFNKESTLRSSSIAFSMGVVSKYPKINYLLASKAERDRNDKC